MIELAFQLPDWAAWTPGRESRDAWRAWAAGDPRADTAPAEGRRDPPVLLRRRVSPLGQAALRAAWGLPEVGRGRYVFASRHGEFRRTVTILDSLAACDTPSPSDFSLSVHNALAGLLSIAAGNTRGHTAVAAGPESFGFGLMEAVACCHETPGEPVVLVYYDEPLPPPFDAFDDADGKPLATAFAVTRPEAGEKYVLEVTPAPGDAARSPSTALDFLRFLGSTRTEAVSVGERMRWRWRRDG